MASRFFWAVRHGFVAATSAPIWARILAFLFVMTVVLGWHNLQEWWHALLDPTIDLFVSVGIGVLTAFLAILAGVLTTKELLYRALFWTAGTMLAALFIVSGSRQYKSAMAALKNPTPKDIVMAAVNMANQHTDHVVDAATAKANGHTDSKVSELRGDLKSTTETLSNEFSKGQDTIAKQIAQLKPAPAELAKLQFSFYRSEFSKYPLVISPMQIGIGTFSVEFTARNISSVQARDLEIWVQICQACSYAKEPDQFDKPQGSDEHIRHRVFGNLNAGVFMNKMSVDVRLTSSFTSFSTSFNYACANCEREKPWDQALTTMILH